MAISSDFKVFDCISVMIFANKFVYFYICGMKNTNLTDALKGIHPGKIIARDIKKMKISQRNLAERIGEHSQTLNAVIKGRRNMTVEMAVKLDLVFGYEEGFLYMLQGYYEVEQYRQKAAAESVSGIPDVRRILFWDTDFDKINWGYRKSFVISRIMERGNEAEKVEIARFYGMEVKDLEKYRSRNRYKLNRQS